MLEAEALGSAASVPPRTRDEAPARPETSCVGLQDWLRILLRVSGGLDQQRRGWQLLTELQEETRHRDLLPGGLLDLLDQLVVAGLESDRNREVGAVTLARVDHATTVEARIGTDHDVTEGARSYQDIAFHLHPGPSPPPRLAKSSGLGRCGGADRPSGRIDN